MMNVNVINPAELAERIATEQIVVEVSHMSASTPELAQKLGDEYAMRYTARGYLSRCIGVVEHHAVVEQMSDLGDGQAITETGRVTINRAGYKPVIQALDRKRN